jgi:hypothetical protein
VIHVPARSLGGTSAGQKTPDSDSELQRETRIVLGKPAGAVGAAVVLGGLHDHRDRSIETDPRALASWALLRGRVPGREDVIVRGHCVGWLQRHQGRYVACTLDGPVGASASKVRQDAVLALFAALYAPVPLPELGPQAHQPRRLRARPRGEKPLSPYTDAQLAATALTDQLQRADDGSNRVRIDDGLDQIELGAGVCRLRAAHWAISD